MYADDGANSAHAVSALQRNGKQPPQCAHNYDNNPIEVILTSALDLCVRLSVDACSDARMNPPEEYYKAKPMYE